MRVIPNQKMTSIFPISCILALIFPIFIKYFPKYEGKGSFPKSQIKSLVTHGFSFSADYSQLSFTSLICVQCFNECLIVLELLIFNKLSCRIIDTISASIFE